MNMIAKQAYLRKVNNKRESDNYQVYLLARCSVLLSPPNGTPYVLSHLGIRWMA